MEKTFTVTVPTGISDFTGFVGLSEVQKTAVLFEAVSTIGKLEALAIQQGKKINYLNRKTKTLEMASRPQEQGIEPSTTDTVDVAKTRVKIAKAEVPASTGEKSTGNEGSTFGKKIGKSSRYHFINVQMRNNKFYNYRASTSIGGKSVGMGTSKDEIQCALMADAYLDKIGDEKRKRNRDEFPEVREAFIAKTEGEKIIAKTVAKVAGGSEW